MVHIVFVIKVNHNGSYHLIKCQAWPYAKYYMYCISYNNPPSYLTLHLIYVSKTTKVEIDGAKIHTWIWLAQRFLPLYLAAFLRSFMFIC